MNMVYYFYIWLYKIAILIFSVFMLSYTEILFFINFG